MSNNFENNLRERLEDHRSDIDTQAIWEAVEPRLPKNKKRRILPFWLLGLGLAIFVITGIWITGSSPSSTTEPLPAKVTSRISSMTNSDDLDCPPVQESNQFSALTNEVAMIFPNEGTNNPTPKNDPHETNAREALESTTSSNTDVVMEAPAELMASTTIDESTRPNRSFGKGISFLSIPLQNALPITSSPISIPPINDYEIVEEKRIKSTIRSYFSFEANTGISSLHRRTEVLNADVGFQQLMRIEETERPLEQFSTQLLLGYHSRWGVTFRTGLMYQRNNSRLDYEQSFTEDFVDPNGIIAIRVNNEGDTTFTRGPVNTTREVRINTRYYNSYTSYDFPLLLGYQFKASRFKVHLETGPVINISTVSKAHLFRGNNIFQEATNGTGYFRRRISSNGWQFNATLAYPISNNGMLTASSRYFRYGGGFENQSAGYQTAFSSIGLNIGYRVRF